MHAVGKHPAPDQLKLEWDFALFGRDVGSRSRMAYWSDLVHPGTPKHAEMSVGTKATEAPLNLDAVLEDAGQAADNDQAREFSLAFPWTLLLGMTATIEPKE